MKFIVLPLILVFIILQTPCFAQQLVGKFNPDKDLLLGQFDCKTDVDDLHSAAAFVTLLTHPDFAGINYHAVAGTYGVQEGLYVPPNDLFQLAFEDKWNDADASFDFAVIALNSRVGEVLNQGGDIWIAEAGQSDFSAALVKAVQESWKDINTKERIHIVQHSNWNEEVTSKEALAYVKLHTDYHKIPDGNAVGNGTPGFRTNGYDSWKNKIKDPYLMDIWKKAIDLGLEYNGKEGRYNNEAVATGGVDFSDLSETCWILGLENIKDSDEFFTKFGR